MREIRKSGSEGGARQTNVSFLPLSLFRAAAPFTLIRLGAGELAAESYPPLCNGSRAGRDVEFELGERTELPHKGGRGGQGLVRHGRALDAHGINRSNEQGRIGLPAALHPKSSCSLCGEFHQQRGGSDRIAGEVVFEKPQVRIEMPSPYAFRIAAFKSIQKTESGAVRSEGSVHFSSRE